MVNYLRSSITNFKMLSFAYRRGRSLPSLVPRFGGRVAPRTFAITDSIQGSALVPRFDTLATSCDPPDQTWT